MRIVILGHGTRGDVAPMMSLATGLWESGYNVTLMAPGDFADAAEEHSVPYIDTGVNAEQVVRQPAVTAALRAVEQRQFWKLNLALPIIRTHRQVSETVLSCLLANLQPDDLLVFPLTARVLAGVACAEVGNQQLGVHFAPLHDTAEFPHALLRRRTGFAFRNRFSHRLGNLIAGRAFQTRSRALIRRFGLKLRQPQVLREIASNSTPAACLWSPLLQPAPADWPREVKVVGYPAFDQDFTWEPPADLADFMLAGSPPVYVGFGSVPSGDARAVGETILSALRKAGQRGILHRGWGGIEDLPQSDDVFFCDHVPHSWLFPRMAAVAHHCGCGTTHAALRSGRVSIPIPVAVDQPFWAHRLHTVGVATAPLPRHKLTANALADRIRQAISSRSLQARAAEVGYQISQEQPVENFARILRQHFELLPQAERRTSRQENDPKSA